MVGGRAGFNGETRGYSTTGFGATILGGGCGGNATWNVATYANSGGSGSGGKSVPDEWSRRTGDVGVSIKGSILNSATLYNGNIGGYGVVQTNQVASAGGGGANGVGGNGSTGTTGSVNVGGAGIGISILDTLFYWGGGGGGGNYISTPSNGGIGGGGCGNRCDGNPAINTNGSNGLNCYETGYPSGYNDPRDGCPSSGGGGGGGGYQINTNGYGGSGVIILKYRRPIEATRVVDYVKTGTPATVDYKAGMSGGDYKIQSIQSSTTRDRFVVDGLSGHVEIGERALVIKSNGNVSINNNVSIGGIDPVSAYRLNINGDININGNIWQNGFSVNDGFQQYRTFNFTYSGDTNFLLTTRARYCNIICWCITGTGYIVSNGTNMVVNEFRGSLGFNSILNGSNNYFFYWTMQGDTPRPFKAWFGNGSNTTFTFIEMWYN